MGNFRDDYEGNGGNTRKRDYVLTQNEYAFIQSNTDGSIKCCVGPYQTSLSQQETPVIFNTQNKRFEECSDYDQAKQLFVSAPEGWYIQLKNPTADGKHPEAGRPNQSPTNIEIGKKINIAGPTSFALFPGQMARVIQGHRLRTNQYLIARVYDVNEANKTVVEGSKTTYEQGEQLIIKGTDVAFYIPPTGIEVVPASDGNFVREAVTLERLEYCILKSENGNKRYLHGPAVVFPEPTEVFMKTDSGSYCFRAIELSKISGIYVKVIAEYEENGVNHPVGEELFITGNEQMIYYPRPEHAIIKYDGKMMHHAIAIPTGEGRYVMNRETGVISTILGPRMYLPDPRFEVIVKRKLSRKQCQLWYPNNEEVLMYNAGLETENVLETKPEVKCMNMVETSCCPSHAEGLFNGALALDSLKAALETDRGISRGNTYSKPRTITLDNKYDGVVAIDVWTGYAINVISKSGKRDVVIGPKTRILEYDETLEYMELSTGKPKTTDHLLPTAYLRIDNNKISDIINVTTKDFVRVDIKLSYCVDFLEEYKDKWFSVENYVKYLCDRVRSLLKREIKTLTIEEFLSNATDIVRSCVLGKNTKKDEKTAHKGRLFEENGMLIKDVEMLSAHADDEITKMLNAHQTEIVKKNLELSNAEKRFAITKQLTDFETAEREMEHKVAMESLERKKAEKEAEIQANMAIEAQNAAKTKAQRQAEADMQSLLDAIKDAELAREKKDSDNTLYYQRENQKIQEEAQKAYAATVEKIISAIGPDLVAALTSKANSAMLETVTKSISPYALASDESVSDVTNKLLRGTSLEGVIDQFIKKND